MRKRFIRSRNSWKNSVLYRHTVFNKSIDSGTQQPVGYLNDFF